MFATWLECFFCRRDFSVTSQSTRCDVQILHSNLCSLYST